YRRWQHSGGDPEESWESMSYDLKVQTLKTAQQMLECWKIKFFRTLAVNPMKKHVAGTEIWTKLGLLKS
ncbi:hypothetical protein M9458_051571, partial [Cirrhinus mrigala]